MENRINYIDEKLNQHIFEDHQFQLKITKELSEISTKLAMWAGLPSVILLIFELVTRFFFH